MYLSRKQVRTINWRLYIRATVGIASLVAVALWPAWNTIVVCLSAIWASQFVAACFFVNQEVLDSDAMIFVVLTVLVGATVGFALMDDGNDALQVQARVAAFLPLLALAMGVIYVSFVGLWAELQNLFTRRQT